MHGDPLSGALSILIVFLYSVCAITTFYCLLAGFYTAVNPQPYNIFRYFVDHWRRIFLSIVPLAIIFWFTASYAAVFCKVAYESYSPGSGYYFHKMSLFLPTCGNVGSWSYGKIPPSSIPGLTVGAWKPDVERVILRNSLVLYLLSICFIIAWVGNYVIYITFLKGKHDTKPSRSADA